MCSLLVRCFQLLFRFKSLATWAQPRSQASILFLRFPYRLEVLGSGSLGFGLRGRQAFFKIFGAHICDGLKGVYSVVSLAQSYIWLWPSWWSWLWRDQSKRKGLVTGPSLFSSQVSVSGNSTATRSSWSWSLPSLPTRKIARSTKTVRSHFMYDSRWS